MEQKSKSEVGIWTENEQHYHQNCSNLAKDLAVLLNRDETVIDFGCGNAYYIDFLKDNGFVRTIGIDGYTTRQDIFQKDLSEPLFLGIKGQVISLEVGEHIPKEFEEVFLNNITQHCDSLLILSWAIPGQPGIGHVNCQSNDYIISQLQKRGFRFLPGLTEIAREDICENTPWFKDTLMIFK